MEWIIHHPEKFPYDENKTNLYLCKFDFGRQALMNKNLKGDSNLWCAEIYFKDYKGNFKFTDFQPDNFYVIEWNSESEKIWIWYNVTTGEWYV